MKKKTIQFLGKYGWYLPGIVFTIFFYFILPRPLFHDPYSSVLLDKDGELLGAKISKDGQWRFPESSGVPFKFKEAVIAFEDQHFYHHLGVNPVSTARALYQNIKEGRIVSGGSTLTMQTIRLARKNPDRSFLEKFYEMFLAFRLELTHSKEDILTLYASHAPFGSNVVGLDAAAWRYFGVSPDHLSWAESATLAVLPNSPSLIYPGKNQLKLLNKRNRLLDKLYYRGVIDESTLELSKNEPLPDKPFPLPQLAPHLLERAVLEGNAEKKINSTLSAHLQEKVNEILLAHHRVLAANGVNNAAAIVVNVNTGNVLAYVGNIEEGMKKLDGDQVDIIVSPRSTGSILKPYLYCAMLNDGFILPTTLIPDIPMQIGGFMPENYSLTYDGAVPAKRALARSLNIPAVKMLQTYGFEQFHSVLKKLGITTMTKPSGHYGLSLILGGAEADLWDLVGVYASLARILNHYSQFNGKYLQSDLHPLSYLTSSKENQKNNFEDHSIFSAANIWLTFQAMVEVARPDEETFWQQFSSSSKIAWKTGTSFGNRDAWSIGVTPQYVVGVWAGNASGEGRPGLTGIDCAAPILFDIFKSLPSTTWFQQPVDEMIKIPVCKHSGYRISSICDEVDTIWASKMGLRTGVCPYHQWVHLDKTGKWQVNSNCEDIDNMINTSWFVLPPVMEWYYQNKNPYYKALPPFRSDCLTSSEVKSMDMIYPHSNSKIYIPVDIDGKQGTAVFKLAHRNPHLTVYWHLDDTFIGSTKQYHQMELSPTKGMHRLTLVDEKGETLKISFEILNNSKAK
ncbi:MAG: penicillin-binding protein 1C [Bacteroidota bacterium]